MDLSLLWNLDGVVEVFVICPVLVSVVGLVGEGIVGFNSLDIGLGVGEFRAFRVVGGFFLGIDLSVVVLGVVV